MNKDDVFKALEGVTNLPTLPAIMQKLTAAVNDPHASADQIAGIIKDDPAMMARILKIVNSAVYGLPQTIESLPQALSIMGMTALNNVALSTAVFSSCGPGEPEGFDRNAFWHHCICVGIAVEVVYKETSETLSARLSKDVMHLAGLLHDIGKILLDQTFPTEFAEAVRRGGEKEIPLYEAELEIFGTHHAEVGAWLGTRWNLSPELLQVIRWHHEPERADGEHVELLRLCHTANHICNIRNLGNGGDATSAFSMGVWKRIGLGVRDISGIVDDVQEESAKSETLLATLSGD